MSTPPPPSPGRPIESPSELRWAQWLANGAYQDAVLQRRATAAAVLIGCGAAAWLALAIYLR